MNYWKEKSAGLLDEEDLKHDANPYSRQRSGSERWIKSAYGPWAYHYKNGDPWAIVRRFDSPDLDDKACIPYAWDPEWRDWSRKAGLPRGPRILFNLPEIYANPGELVYFFEGEKKVEIASKRLGLIATTAIQGAGNSTQEAMEDLRGRIVFIVPDNNDKGRTHAIKVATQLYGVAKEVRIVELPRLEPGEDLEEWLDDRGGSKEEFLKLAAEAPIFKPNIGLEDFVAYLPEHNYIYLRTRAYWPGSSVNARLPAVAVGDKTVPPSSWLDRHRRVEVQTWIPGQPTIIKGYEFTEDDGLRPHPDSSTFNLYHPPTIKLGDPAGAGRWLDLIKELYPSDKDHIIACCAHARQRPDVKINHVLLLGGNQGIGKDTILAGLERAVGFSNYRTVTPSQIIESQFNGEFKTVVLYISEVHDLGIGDRIKFYNVMKDKLAVPPTNIRINEKYRQPYYIPNLLFPVTTTNFRTGGIYLPPDDRRHYVAWSEVKKGNHPAKWWKQYYEWFDSGGDECIAGYLQAYDLSNFNPKAEPIKTEAWHAMVNASRSLEELELTNVLDQLGGRGATMGMIVREAIALEYTGLAEWLRDARNHKIAASRLEEAGYSIIRNPDEEKGRWRLKQVGGKTLQRIVYGPIMNGDGKLLSTDDRIKLARVLRDDGEPAKAFEDPGG